jgi:hypothetical protein
MQSIPQVEFHRNNESLRLAIYSRARVLFSVTGFVDGYIQYNPILLYF